MLLVQSGDQGVHFTLADNRQPCLVLVAGFQFGLGLGIPLLDLFPLLGEFLFESVAIVVSGLHAALRALEPEHMAPSHTRPVSGAERVSEIRRIIAASVVVLPDPVMPVTSTSPRRSWQISSITEWWPSWASSGMSSGTWRKAAS